MKKFLVIVIVLIVWAIFFWTLYQRVPEVKTYVNTHYSINSLKSVLHSAN